MNASNDTADVVADRRAPRHVEDSQIMMRGRVWDVARERVVLNDNDTVVRDYVCHPGAVAIIAMDSRNRVLLLSQYRHPVRSVLWEPPAGLLDHAGESPHEAAVRELWEEADLRAGRWDVLVDYYSSPGGSDEALRVFLARDLTEVPPAERHIREDEERDMEQTWVTLDDAERAVLGGMIHNPSAVVGVLAAAASSRSGWVTLRSHDAPWLRSQGDATT